VDVGLNDDAVVEGDRGVTDDVVVHWVGLVYRVKDCALVSRAPRCVSCSR
jgi:hypothetical protein